MEPHKQLWKPTASAVSWSRSKFLSLCDLDIQQVALVRSLRVKLPPAHLSATRDGGFTLSLLIADRQARKLRLLMFIAIGFTRRKQT